MMSPMPETTPPATSARTLFPSGPLIVITLAAALVCALGLRQFRDILAPLVLALMFSIAVSPIRRRLKARGAPEWLATGAMVVTAYAFVIGFAWAALALGTHFARMVGDYGDEVNALLQQWTDGLASAGIAADQLDAAAATIDVSRLQDVVVAFLGGVVGVLSSFVFVAILLFFTVLDAGSFGDKLARVSERGTRVAAALSDFATGTRSYLVVATCFGALVALVDVAILTLLGVPDAWLWGLLAFLTNYIPNVGFVIGVIPPAFVALVEQGAGTALAVVAAYCVVNFVIQMIVQPRVVGIRVGLSASLTFLSLLWWGAIFGGLGAIIAVPMTILVKSVFVDRDPDRSWVRPLLESGGPREPDDSSTTDDTEPAKIDRLAGTGRSDGGP